MWNFFWRSDAASTSKQSESDEHNLDDDYVAKSDAIKHPADPTGRRQASDSTKSPIIAERPPCDMRSAYHQQQPFRVDRTRLATLPLNGHSVISARHQTSALRPAKRPMSPALRGQQLGVMKNTVVNSHRKEGVRDGNQSDNNDDVQPDADEGSSKHPYTLFLERQEHQKRGHHRPLEDFNNEFVLHSSQHPIRVSITKNPRSPAPARPLDIRVGNSQLLPTHGKLDRAHFAPIVVEDSNIQTIPNRSMTIDAAARRKIPPTFKSGGVGCASNSELSCVNESGNLGQEPILELSPSSPRIKRLLAGVSEMGEVRKSEFSQSSEVEESSVSSHQMRENRPWGYSDAQCGSSLDITQPKNRVPRILEKGRKIDGVDYEQLFCPREGQIRSSSVQILLNSKHAQINSRVSNSNAPRSGSPNIRKGLIRPTGQVRVDNIDHHSESTERVIAAQFVTQRPQQLVYTDAAFRHPMEDFDKNRPLPSRPVPVGATSKQQCLLDGQHPSSRVLKSFEGKSVQRCPSPVNVESQNDHKLRARYIQTRISQNEIFQDGVRLISAQPFQSKFDSAIHDNKSLERPFRKLTTDSVPWHQMEHSRIPLPLFPPTSSTGCLIQTIYPTRDAIIAPSRSHDMTKLPDSVASARAAAAAAVVLGAVPVAVTPWPSRPRRRSASEQQWDGQLPASDLGSIVEDEPVVTVDYSLAKSLKLKKTPTKVPSGALERRPSIRTSITKKPSEKRTKTSERNSKPPTSQQTSGISGQRCQTSAVDQSAVKQIKSKRNLIREEIQNTLEQPQCRHPKLRTDSNTSSTKQITEFPRRKSVMHKSMGGRLSQKSANEVPVERKSVVPRSQPIDAVLFCGSSDHSVSSSEGKLKRSRTMHASAVTSELQGKRKEIYGSRTRVETKPLATKYKRPKKDPSKHSNSDLTTPVQIDLTPAPTVRHNELRSTERTSIKKSQPNGWQRSDHSVKQQSAKSRYTSSLLMRDATLGRPASLEGLCSLSQTGISRPCSSGNRSMTAIINHRKALQSSERIQNKSERRQKDLTFSDVRNKRRVSTQAILPGGVNSPLAEPTIMRVKFNETNLTGDADRSQGIIAETSHDVLASLNEDEIKRVHKDSDDTPTNQRKHSLPSELKDRVVDVINTEKAENTVEQTELMFVARSREFINSMTDVENCRLVHSLSDCHVVYGDVNQTSIEKTDGAMNYETYIQELAKALEDIPSLLGRELVSYPRKSFIVKRDKEMRKIKNFGWQYAAKELQSILPTLSRFTIEHHCDTQKSRLTGLDGAPLICQSQLLTQITQGLQTRDVFGYYFRLGAPANESINQRLNRFADKRRIQNATRRFLEHLLLNDELLALVVGTSCNLWRFGGVPPSFSSVAELRNCILLPGSVAERSIVLSAIFTFLWNRFQLIHPLVSPYSINPLTNEKEECLSLHELTVVLNELDLWPSETNLEDRHEIALSLIASHPDLLPMLQGKLGVPHTITCSVFVNSLLPLPFNLPDFPAPELPKLKKQNKKLTDTELLYAAFEICHAVLDVQHTPSLLFQRQQLSLAAAAAVLQEELPESSEDGADRICRIADVRLFELMADGFQALGLPPRSFNEQDILLSQMVSVEELQTLLILSRTSRRSTTAGLISPECCTSDSVIWDVRVLVRCIHFIVGLVKECLTDLEWQWIGNPFRSDLNLPQMSTALIRCIELQNRLSSIKTAELAAKPQGISSAARVIAICSKIDQLDSPTTDSTSPGVTTSPGASAESVLLRTPDKYLQTSGAQNPSQQEDPKLPGEFSRIPPFTIDWTTFIESSAPLRQTFVDEIPNNRPIPTGCNPLLYMPSAFRGADDLWALKTEHADPNLVGGVAGDPSGLLPIDLLSLQACCRIFEVLVFESGCFVNQLRIGKNNRKSSYDFISKKDIDVSASQRRRMRTN